MLGMTALAQQDAQFTQYMFNNLYNNPAYAGVDGVTRLSAFHRSQWLGYQSSFGDGGAPTTQFFGVNAPIFKIKGGAGFYVMNDRQGPLNRLDAQAAFAYHLGIKESKLSFGLRVGTVAQTINYDLYRPIQRNDRNIPDGGRETQIKPDLSAGIFYRTEKYYGGVGFSHLIESEFDFGGDDLQNALVTHMTLTGGYFYDVSFDLQINPTLLVKTDFNEYSFDLGVIATLKNTMWGGLSFRQSEAAILILGYSLLKDKSLKVGYALDYVVKNQDAKQATSHELMITYELPVTPGSGKKVVRTPRYRH
jgi:type IX secretion system PorP/SprF family membrane protein